MPKDGLTSAPMAMTRKGVRLIELMLAKMFSGEAQHKYRIKQRSWLPLGTVPSHGTVRSPIQALTQKTLIHTSSPLGLVTTPRWSGLTHSRWAVAGSIMSKTTCKTLWLSATMLSVATWLRLQCTSREQHAHLAQQGSVVTVTVFALLTMSK